VERFFKEYPKMIKGIFFDLGGTLYTYKNIPTATAPLLNQALEKVGLVASKDQVKNAYIEATNLVIKEYSGKRYYLHESFFSSVFKSFIELLGGIAKNELNDWYINSHRECIVNCLELKTDCISVLKTLKKKGVYISIVSNIDQDMLEPLIARDQLNKYLHHWTSSEKVKSCKPDKKIFQHALKLANLRAKEILFVGDSPEHDIAGASRLGMLTTLITNGGMPPPLQSGMKKVTPDFTVKELSDILEVIES
jgi:putative hydrolase of the HAD superfamily